MNSIRKLVGIGTGAFALCAIAGVVASSSALAHASDQTVREAASARTLATAEAAPSADCVAARQAIAAARLDDRTEDPSEKLDATGDMTEDQNERAAMKALWVKARAACGDQPKPVEVTTTSPAAASTACADAKTALKNALVAEKAHEMGEKGTTAEHSAADRQEDQAEFAAINALWQTAATACGFSAEHFGHDGK